MPVNLPSRWLPITSLLSISLLVIAVIMTLVMARFQIEANREVTHTVQVEGSLVSVMERSRAIDAAIRGYRVAQQPDLERDLNDASRDVMNALAVVERLIADNPQQKSTLASLRNVMIERITHTRETLRLIKAKDELRLEQRGATGQALRHTRTIERYVRAMLAVEDRLFQERRQAAERAIWLLSISLITSVVLATTIAAVVVVDGRKRYKQMMQARDAADSAAKAAQAEVLARKEVEAQLRQVQKMESIGQLTGGIAHDFNNMLAIVIGSLDMAQRRKSDPEKLQRYLDNAREGAERAATLTARLLAFSRQQPLAPTAINVNRLVSGLSEMLRRTLGEQVAVETVLAGGLWSTFVDSGQLENAMLNLAVNARDAMSGGGKLTIETANAYLDDDYARTRLDVTAGQYVMLCISDTGSGMPASVMERAFDPFFTTKGVGKGTGLGLSQVFGFVKQSGGHIAIYSELGEGTTVRLYLPRHHGAAQAGVAIADGEDDVPEGSAEETILVVEDEARVRHFSVDSLRDLGYTVISADGPIEALRLLGENPAIVMMFTDVIMPEMNGRELADEAKRLRPDLKILYTTGYTRNAVVHNGMLDAGVAFLPKPFTIVQLSRKVRSVLDGGGANRPG